MDRESEEESEPYSDRSNIVQRKSYSQRGSENSGFEKRKSYNPRGSEESGYEKRKSYSQRGSEGSDFEKRKSYNPRGSEESAYEKRKSYSQRGSEGSDFEKRKSYNPRGSEESGYEKRKSYSQRGSEGSDFEKRKSFSQRGSEGSDFDKRKSFSQRGSERSDFEKRKSYQRVSEESNIERRESHSQRGSRESGVEKRKSLVQRSSEESGADRRKSYSYRGSAEDKVVKRKSYSEYSSSEIEEKGRRDSRNQNEIEEFISDDTETRSTITRVSEERGELKDGYHLLTKNQMKLILPFARRWVNALEHTRKELFENIDPHIIYKLVYPDSLEVFVDDDSVGEFTLIMGRVRRKEGACIMIHANSHAVIEGIKCGSDITTIVTMKLETVQHVYHDYVELPRKIVDNKLIVVKDDENYFVKRISFDGEKADKKTEKIPRKNLIGYISEGACFLLHRYILKTQVKVPICLNTLDMNLQKCSVTFSPVEEAAQLVQGSLLYTLGILQTTMGLDGATDTWITYYNRIDLHMTRRQQFGSPTEMLLVRLPIGLGRPAPDFMSDWEGNPELWSHFVERKASLMTDYMEYLHKHDEIKALLSDFLLFLLHRKPTDICDAATYFFNDFLKDY